VSYRASAKCDCGETACPQRAHSVALVRDQVRTWLLKMGFARQHNGGGALLCPICKSELRVLVAGDDAG